MGARGALVVAVAAVALCFVAPPAGLALAVVAVVASVRVLRATAPQERTFTDETGALVRVPVAQPGRGLAVAGLVVGVAAALLGALLTLALVVFWDEVRDYVECRDQANTVQGRERCDDELRDAVLG